MRSALVAACTLLTLSGCGRNSADPPQAAMNSSPGGTSSQKPETPPAGDPGAGAKPETPPVAAGPGFDVDDPQQTLRWLIRSAAKLRATPPGDAAALDKEWAGFDKTVQAASGRKIHWQLTVEQVLAEGITTEPVKTPNDPACRGLRLKPDQQPAGFATFILELPAAARAGLRPGSRVLVTGVVARIETGLSKAHPNAPDYDFGVRLRDYTVSPLK
jgi:hypothetical protein